MSAHNVIPRKYLSVEFIEKVNQIYHDLEALEYDKLHPEIFRREVRRWERMLAATKIKRDEKLRVLDVGTGTGFAAYQVLSRFPNSRVKYVDISEEMIRMAERKLRKIFLNSDLSFEQRSADQIDYSPCSYDLITMNSVLLPTFRTNGTCNSRIIPSLDGYNDSINYENFQADLKAGEAAFVKKIPLPERLPSPWLL
jgi:trans-aconitate methyltransferase